MRAVRLGVGVAVAALALTGCTVSYTPDPAPKPSEVERSVPSPEGTWTTFCLAPGVRMLKRDQAYGKAYAALDVRDRPAPDPWACP